MKKQKKFAYPLVFLLILHVFYLPVIAAYEPDIKIMLDKSTSTVGIGVTGLMAGSQVSFMGYYDDELDYIDQYETDGDGNFHTTYPSSKTWSDGDVIKIKIGGGGLATPIEKSVTFVESDFPEPVLAATNTVKNASYNLKGYVVEAGELSVFLGDEIIEPGLALAENGRFNYIFDLNEGINTIVIRFAGDSGVKSAISILVTYKP